MSTYETQMRTLTALQAENAALKAELKAINAALDDPRTDLTMTACEVIADLKKQVEQLNLENLSLINQNIHERQEYGDAKAAFAKQIATLQSRSAALVDAATKAAKHIRPTCDELYYELMAALAAFKGEK